LTKSANSLEIKGGRAYSNIHNHIVGPSSEEAEDFRENLLARIGVRA